MLSQLDQSKVRYRYIRVEETIRDEWALKATKQPHVLTLATVLKDNKIYIGYSLNRVPKIHCFNSVVDRFNPEYGKKRALGRLNSSNPIILNHDTSKPMIKNIVDGLLSIPTTKPDIFDPQSVPSALKNLLKKNLKEYNNKNEISNTK